MILIISKAYHETTTEKVMDWLEHLGVEVLRLNGEDLDGETGFTLELEDGDLRIAFDTEPTAPLSLDRVEAVWYRRWGTDRIESIPLLEDPSRDATTVAKGIDKHLRFELWKTSQAIFHSLKRVPWLSDPEHDSPNKLTVLHLAAQVGLDTPATLVTTRREALRRFLTEQGTVITKPIGEPEMFFFPDRFFTMYTAEVTPDLVDELPERFFPSLFQEKLDKQLEIRVFHLDGQCFPMAIFSQLDDRTRCDFRCYNSEKPNRTVPYRLTRDLEKKIVELMARLDLETGSLDFVATLDGRIVFLEVNPIGQFGMISQPCNYGLERRVAEALIRRMRDGAT
jgi:ATP-GRASP peptide maturase of grasp-with-spasm system